MITVIIAVDHCLIRQGLRLMLEADKEFVPVGDADTSVEALRLTGQRKPDVLILDLTLPGASAWEVIRRMRRESPSTKVVVFARTGGDAHASEAFRHGALSFLGGTSAPNDFVQALREAAAGRRYFGPDSSRRFFKGYRHEKADSEPERRLTNRERTVLTLAVEGHSSTQIAQKLQISPRTAETHRANLMRKLGLRSQTELVRFAIRRELVPA